MDPFGCWELYLQYDPTTWTCSLLNCLNQVPTNIYIGRGTLEPLHHVECDRTLQVPQMVSSHGDAEITIQDIKISHIQLIAFIMFNLQMHNYVLWHSIPSYQQDC
jgi:hypothetical protein